VDSDQNLLTVQRGDCDDIIYDPRRLQGVNVYREEEREFSAGDRIQFTAPYKDEHIANRQLGTIKQIDADGNLQIRLDSGRTVDLKLQKHPHPDYGYVVTSHSGQGTTADRVLVHVDTGNTHERLINSRLAYVAVSRGRYDAQIYTNDATSLGDELSREVSHTAALEWNRIEAAGVGIDHSNADNESYVLAIDAERAPKVHAAHDNGMER